MEHESLPSPQRSRLRRLINRLEVDQAVFYAITSRAWSFLSGPITMLLIAALFTPALQDYFYVFWFLLGMQTFFELSMDVVIVNVASHEWASLSLGTGRRIEGNETARQRLASLWQLTRRWYRVAASLFLLIVGLGGIWFLSQRDLPRELWLAPWVSLAVLASVQLNLLPALGILEGCGQLAVINRLRTVQAIAGSLVVWAAIAGGLGLWSLVGAAAVRLLLDGWLVLRHFRVFFGSLNDPAAAGAIAWRDEIWPLQWRVAVQSIITYFSLNMFSAVMFEYHDEGVAGRMGMTWSIVSTIQRAAFAWVETRRPLFGSLIAQGNFEQLDRIFGRLTRISVAVLAAGYVVFLLALIGLSHLDLWLARRLSERLLDLTPTAMLCLATVVLQVARCQNIYVRAHKRDPFLVPSLVTNSVNVLLVWQLGRRFGPSGAAVGFLATVVLLLAPWWWSIWQTARTQWHIPTDGHAAARSMPTGD